MSAVALLACSAAFAQTPSRDVRPRTASVSGRVTVGGKDAAKVTVTVTEAHSDIRETRTFTLGGREFVDHYFHQTVTDSEGRYQVGGLPAGVYLVAPKAPAHVPESKALGPDASVRITLDEGEAREGVDFALVRGGVITGRVTDEEGRPQVGRRVRLLEVIDGGQWREVSEIFGKVLETDDRGVFRLFGLRRGRYAVKAGGEDDTLRYAVRGKRTQVTYHPDAVNQSEAKVVEVEEGSEVAGIDIRLRNPVKSFAAAGQVIDAETGRPLPQVRIACFPVEDQEQESGNWAADAVTDAGGRFTATGLKPGRYRAKLAPPLEGGTHYSEGKYFEVSDDDVTGVEILARRGAVVSGVVIVEEGGDAATQTKLSQTRLSVRVYKEYSVGTVRHTSSVWWLIPKIGGDGSFRLVGAPPGKMTIDLSRTSSGPFHLLRLERGGVEVRDGLEVGPGEEINDLRLIVGQGNGVLRGSLKVVGGVLPAGVSLSVYAFREGPSPIDKSAEVDDKGRFVILGLVTGEYLLGVSPQVKSPSGQSPKMARFRQQRVRVTNGAETEVTLTYDLSRQDQEKQ